MAAKTRKTYNHRSNKPIVTKQGPNDKQQQPQKNETKKNYLQLIDGKGFPFFVLAIFIVFVLYQTLVTNRVVFWKLHDQSLFLTDLTYLKECLSIVGGLSVYVSSFFNDFFIYPWLGSLIYTSFLILVAIVTSKAFNLKGWLYPLAFIPSLLLLLSVIQNGYMIYLIKLDAYAYAGVLGMLVAVTGALLGSTARKPVIQSLIAVLYLLVAYPLAGVYGVVGTLLLVVYSIKQVVTDKQLHPLITVGAALLAVWLVPRAYDQWVYQATNQQQLYLSNLPDYWNTESERFLWLPYLIGAGYLLLFALLPKKLSLNASFFKLLPFVLFLGTLLLADTKSFKDENFKTELRMMEASEEGDWSEVLQLSREVKDEPTRLIVMYTNMALFKIDKLADTKYQYVDGNKARNDPRGILDVNIAGPFFYFNYGKMNYCYRWCMENTVEYGQSPSNLTYFVLSCAINGQKPLARKYNSLLAKSLFHKSLAKKLETIIEDPSLLDKDPTYSKVLTMTNYGDLLDSDYSKLETYLRFNFAYTIGGPFEMVELCMLANMDLINPNLFWPAYFTYIEKFNRPLPIHIQEAALLFNHLQKTSYIDPARFNPAVLDRFNQFLSMVQQYAGMPDYTVSNFFKVPFGDTYWYYFSFIKNNSVQSSSPTYSPYSS